MLSGTVKGNYTRVNFTFRDMCESSLSTGTGEMAEHSGRAKYRMNTKGCVGALMSAGSRCEPFAQRTESRDQTRSFRRLF